jgi:hypothetical protein
MSTKVILILALFYIYLPKPSFAQILSNTDESEFLTKGWSNGIFWETLNTQEKIYYIVGLEEGLALAKNYVGEASEYDELIIEGYHMSDFTSEIDTFYSDSTNINIPIAFAYHYMIKKMKGKTAEELEEYVEWLRNYIKD